MAVTYIDLVDGDSGKQTIEGWELTRMAIVTGVTGDGHAKIYNAANELPSIGSAHPTISSIYLREIIPESLDANTVRFRLVYGIPKYPIMQPRLNTVEVGGTLNQLQTNKDADGDIISVGYTFPSDYKLDPNLQSKMVNTSSLVNKLAPQHSIVYSRLIFNNPQFIARNFVGTVNLGGWYLDGGAAARTWLCTGIVGRSNDDGISFTTTYSFQYRDETWDSVVVFIDPNTGAPPDDLVTGTGIKSYNIYPIRNFDLIFS